MNTSQLTFPLPGSGSAVLTLPQSITPETLMALERSLAEALGKLQRGMGHVAADPGQIEYESWLPHLAVPRH